MGKSSPGGEAMLATLLKHPEQPLGEGYREAEGTPRDMARAAHARPPSSQGYD